MKKLFTIPLILFTMVTTISAQSLSDRQKHLATIAALEAQGDLIRLEPAIKAALDGGVTINEIKEAFSQLYAYTGFPRSLNALGVLSKVIESGNGKYNEGKPWVRPAIWEDAKKSLEVGTEVQTKLFGPVKNEFSPQNDYYLKAHLFGDIFAGDQLSAADREIVTVAALSALKGVAPQLAAHKAGAVNIG
ncbi:MAG: carboxymuconolactone decarboxylase family protein, partial [Salinivirgaceae bacterium]|nr:carboxymuconolactone decarboxylase family protein [Salinivirgaceae bacterium]